MQVKFIIPGPAVAKQRPRLGRNGSVYTPNKTKNYERLCKLSYGNNYHFKEEFIEINILFKFEVPKSYTKKRRSEALSGLLRPTKADIDNFIKSCLDGLNKVAFEDDRKVVKIVAEKIYADVSETIIEIKSL